MSPPQQEFTFINVNAAKKSNARTIKRHVSNQINRRKRQEAVTRYRQTLLEAVEPSSSTSEASSSPDYPTGQIYTLPYSPRRTPTKEESIDGSTKEDELREFALDGKLIKREPVQGPGYWQAYQEWALKHLQSDLSPDETDSTDFKASKDSKAQRSSRNWRVSPVLSESRAIVTVSSYHVTIHIPRINAPDEFNRIHWALKTCRDFIHGEYEARWKAEWQNKPWYQGPMLPLGIWRECFPLAVEFIEAGKLQEAFFILNAALSVTPSFFKDSNPGLLIALLGAMMYTCQISDHKLSSLIRSHVTQLSMAHLGARHPISLLLREQLRAAEAAHGRTDLLSIAVLDTTSDVFGPTHFVPLSMRFGYIRRSLSSGDFGTAQAAFGILEKAWNEKTMPGAQLPKFLAFEKAKVAYYTQKARGIEQPSKLISLEESADQSIQLPVFVKGKGPSLEPTDDVILKKLGKYLLLHSHYALALFIYSRIPEVFAPTTLEERKYNPNQDPETLPMTVSRIIVDHLKDGHDMWG